jgi:hypothetical protein
MKDERVDAIKLEVRKIISANPQSIVLNVELQAIGGSNALSTAILQ